MGKRSGLFIKSWEVRWVELDVKAGTIRYYAKDTPLSEGACTRGVIYLFETDGRRVRQMHALADNDGQRFCFRIQNNKEHVFSACSHEQRKLWLDTLSAIAQAASGPRRHDSVTVASPEEQYAMASETISDLEAEVSELTQLTLRCNEESTISDEFVMVRCGCQKSLPPVQALNQELTLHPTLFAESNRVLAAANKALSEAEHCWHRHAECRSHLELPIPIKTLAPPVMGVVHLPPSSGQALPGVPVEWLSLIHI
eukprot:TRINITY_DN7314_c0_g1_i4.p1 TRINITY_DN7314_c0_g1~~TRINITY_DN7314_c0_g1_i4.p1  ORF type:complete len:255 (-),score=61.50 TRINITY_DN7314_c0_g1_i4:133-897(-)